MIPESDRHDDGALTATVVEYDDEPDQCTIHPVDPPEGRRTTEWISAEEDSFVVLERLR
jgi:hypothetical protein